MPKRSEELHDDLQDYVDLVNKLQRHTRCNSSYCLRTDRTGKDRKSTRLNSSHGYISYAVFCLKTTRAMASSGFGLKAATITPEGAGAVGSPNRILREEIDGKVIIRTGRRIPCVTPFAGVSYPS